MSSADRWSRVIDTDIAAHGLCGVDDVVTVGALYPVGRVAILPFVRDEYVVGVEGGVTEGAVSEH